MLIAILYHRLLNPRHQLHQLHIRQKRRPFLDIRHAPYAITQAQGPDGVHVFPGFAAFDDAFAVALAQVVLHVGGDGEDEGGVAVLAFLVLVEEQQGADGVDLLEVTDVDEALAAPFVEVHELLVLPVPVFHPAGDAGYIFIGPGAVHALEAVGGALAQTQPVKGRAEAGHVVEVLQGTFGGAFFQDVVVDDEGGKQDDEAAEDDAPRQGLKGGTGDHAAGAGVGGADKQYAEAESGEAVAQPVLAGGACAHAASPCLWAGSCGLWRGLGRHIPSHFVVLLLPGLAGAARAACRRGPSLQI